MKRKSVIVVGIVCLLQGEVIASEKNSKRSSRAASVARSQFDNVAPQWESNSAIVPVNASSPLMQQGQIFLNQAELLRKAAREIDMNEMQKILQPGEEILYLDKKYTLIENPDDTTTMHTRTILETERIGVMPILGGVDQQTQTSPVGPSVHSSAAASAIPSVHQSQTGTPQAATPQPTTSQIIPVQESIISTEIQTERNFRPISRQSQKSNAVIPSRTASNKTPVPVGALVAATQALSMRENSLRSATPQQQSALRAPSVAGSVHSVKSSGSVHGNGNNNQIVTIQTIPVTNENGTITNLMITRAQDRTASRQSSHHSPARSIAGSVAPSHVSSIASHHSSHHSVISEITPDDSVSQAGSSKKSSRAASHHSSQHGSQGNSRASNKSNNQ